MFIKLAAVILILFFEICYAQSDSLRIETERIIDDLIDEPDEESDNSDLYDKIEYYIENPVNLNTASVEDLAIIPYFDLSIARQIIDHRNSYGIFFSPNELYSITSIDENIVKKSLVFLTVSATQTKKATEKNDEPIYSINLRTRVLNALQLERGFKEKIFEGSPYKTYNRLKVKYRNNIIAGLLFEKDAGESSYTDFSSGYINISEWMNITNLIIGDFVPEFGQGLTLWSSYGLTKSSNAIYAVRKYTGNIKPYSSATENNFFRGAAIEKKWGHVLLTGFFSKNYIDANLDSLSEYIISLPIDGLHRTLNEKSKRKSTIETVYGMAVKLNLIESLLLGFLCYNSHFNHSFYSPDLKDINGNNFKYYSSYIDLYLANFNLFGEIAFDGKSIASFNGLTYSPTSDFVYTLSIRNYPKNYTNLHGYGFGENKGKVKNEFGIYNGIRWSTVVGKFNFFFDQFKFPNYTYRNPLPSEGNEFMVSLDNNLSKDFEITIKYNLENKEFEQEVNYQNELVKRLKQSIRTDFTYSPLEMIRLKTRLEYVKFFINDTNLLEEGYVIYQDVRVKPINNLLAYFRVIFFSTDSFNSALYEYENDLTGILSSVGLYGEGMRLYLVMRYNFIKEVSLSFKYSETYKPKETSMLSGYSEFNGNLDNRIGIQLDLNF